MTRTLAALSLFLLATGCFDFAGDQERLGFLTDARLDPATAWTPDHPLAEGTRLKLAVGEILATGEEPTAAMFTARGGTIGVQESGVVLSGTRRAHVHAEADGVRDSFRVRWVPVDTVVVGTPLTDTYATTFAVLPDLPSPLHVAVLDAQGARLGHRPSELRMESTASVWSDDDLPIVETSTDTTLEIAFADVQTRIDLVVVERRDLELQIDQVVAPNGACALVARAFVDDLEVLHPGPVVWSHDATDDVLAPCAPGARVELAPLTW